MRVAVASSVLGTSLVGAILGCTTISIHLREVERAIKAARKVGDVNVKSELLIEEVENLVVAVVCHEVHTRTNVCLLALSDEFHGERITASGDTVCATVVSTIERTVLGASRVVGAQSLVPGVTGVAVSGITRGVRPAPIRVEYDGAARLRCAAALGAF